MAFFRLSQDETLKSRSLLGAFILLTRISAFHFIWSGFIPKSCKNVTCGRWQVCKNCDIFFPSLFNLCGWWYGGQHWTESSKWCSRCHHWAQILSHHLCPSCEGQLGYPAWFQVFRPHRVSSLELTWPSFPPWFIFRIPPLHPSCCRWSGLGQRKGSGEGKSSTMTSLTRCPPWQAQLDLLPDFTCGI